VQECLDSSVDKLKMLPDSRLALALEDFVEKQVIASYTYNICILYAYTYNLHLILLYKTKTIVRRTVLMCWRCTESLELWVTRLLAVRQLLQRTGAR
jgi:hypothetical protein